MGWVRDTGYLAARALVARKSRTLLAMLGPALGVAAIVAAVTYSHSASEQVQATLRAVGTDVVEVVAASGPPGSSSRLPEEAAKRAAAVGTVRSVAPLTRLSGVSAAANGLGLQAANGFGVQATTSALSDVVGLGLAQGRFLDGLDESRAARVAVVGARVADTVRFQAGQPQTIRVGSEDFGIVGALRPTVLASELDSSILIPVATSVALLGEDEAPRRLLVKVEPGSTDRTVDLLDVAITYGAGTPPEVRVPAKLLAAGVAIDDTLRWVVLGMGGLALLVGGMGIANVLAMSVLERAPEIGVRRALGHRRWQVAAQFLGEAVLIGAAGGLAGLVAAVAGVGVWVAQRGWPLAVDGWLVVAALGGAVVVTAVAAVYPAVSAARLDPMRVLRPH